MGDVAVIALCCIVFILLSSSYINRNKSFRIFSAIVGMVFLAAVVNIGYHFLIEYENPNLNFICYAMRLIYNIFLFDVFVMFSLYAVVVANMPHKKARIVAIVATILFVTIIAVDVILTVTGVGFVISSEGKVVSTSNVFMVGYVLFMLFMASLVFVVRKLIYKRVILAFILTMTLSAIIRFAQMGFGESSLTTLTFLLPVLTMLYTMHLNPYNVSTGTLDMRIMEDMVKTLYAKKQSFIFMSLLLPDYVGEGKSFPEEMNNQTRRFTVEYFRNGTLFQVGNGQILMIARKDSNPDYEEWMQTILDAFTEQYRIHRWPYKIVYGESYEEMLTQNDYLALIDFIHDRVPENVMHRVDENDIVRFKQKEFIISQLEDIYRKGDLDDPRVLAYCQPVFNIQTGRFDTAEALMRLTLDDIGFVYPNDFIPLAECNGLIHRPSAGPLPQPQGCPSRNRDQRHGDSQLFQA